MPFKPAQLVAFALGLFSLLLLLATWSHVSQADRLAPSQRYVRRFGGIATAATFFWLAYSLGASKPGQHP